MIIRRAASTAEVDQCFALRRIVFMGEQGVTPADEWDGLDAECIHFLACDGDNPIATARLRPMGSVAKVQRVAVAVSHRGTGLGHRIMRHLLEHAQAEGFVTVTLEAQTHAIAFYEALGFAAHGPEFDDAGIPHRKMRLTLR